MSNVIWLTAKPDQLTPALSTDVRLGLTVLYSALYGLLFAIIFVQLWMIYCYKHRLLSFQTTFLFLCLIWSALRIELFSFYFRNCDLANRLSFCWYWLLYCCPICLQFIILCLLVTFFAQVLGRSNAFHNATLPRQGPVKWCVGMAIVLFLVTNITCAVFAHGSQSQSREIPLAVSVTRVSINDSLFLLLGTMLSMFIYRVSQISTISVVLEAKGTTKRQAVAASILIVILYGSRAVYNVIAIIDRHIFGFGYGWINVTDQADIVSLKEGTAYVSFGIVLFLWEFLPTLTVILFYRVRMPRTSRNPGIVCDAASQRRDIFSNPRRYDSDDEVERDLSYNSETWSSPRGSFVPTINDSGIGVYVNGAIRYPSSPGSGFGNYGTFVHGASSVRSTSVVGSCEPVDDRRRVGAATQPQPVAASPVVYYDGT